MTVPSAEPAGPEMWVRGPTRQQPAGKPATPGDGATTMPRPVVAQGLKGPADGGGRPQRSRRERSGSLSGEGIGWAGAHGGAGASTLARVLGGTDLGCAWPDPSRGEPARVMLVARTHAEGMRAASRALNALREGRHPAGMELVALVLVADAPGRLPFVLANRVRILRSAAPVRRLPWIDAWRLGKETRKLPKELFRLGALAGTRPDGPGESR
ncbi:DUF6668 family protein [Streptomyces sp. NPDC058620]|uniref:DUF6668 family protein n=1 Tax=Streptomyces sp. NPDC058620 TaxID=3346560 RepID=UPI00365E12F2